MELELADFVAIRTHGLAFGALEKLARAGTQAFAPEHCWLAARGQAGDVKREDFYRVLDPGLTMPAMAETWARVIRACSLRRAISRGIFELSELNDDDAHDPAFVAHQVTQFARSLVLRGGALETLGDVNREVMRDILAISEGRRRPYVPTGLDALDAIIHGLPPSLGVIVARGSVGKSAVAGTMLRHIVRRHERALIFCLEDSPTWLSRRFLSVQSGVPQAAIKNRPLSDDEHARVGAAFGDMVGWESYLHVDRRVRLSPQQVLATARRLIVTQQVGSVWVDNMTSMHWPRDGKRSDLDRADFLLDCRALAEEYQVPFIVLAHVRAGSNLKDEDMPTIGDVAEAPGAFNALTRFGLGVAREQDSTEMLLGVIKNTFGRSGFDVAVHFDGASSLVTNPPTPAQMVLA